MKINIKNLITPLINIYQIYLPLQYPPEGIISPVKRVSIKSGIRVAKSKKKSK